MNISSRIACAALAGTLGLSMLAPAPAAADGAASTRNILFGAAAAGGALLIINHNKKVHQKYAEYDQRQAQTQAQANQSEAAYQSEKQAYSQQAALAAEYRHEVAQEHAAVRQRDGQIALLKRSLIVAKANRGTRTTAFVQPATVRYVPAAPQAIARVAVARQVPPQVVSYGWGTY